MLTLLFIIENYLAPVYTCTMTVLCGLGVLCCFALFVCLTLLASFFLPSHLSFKLRMHVAKLLPLGVHRALCLNNCSVDNAVDAEILSSVLYTIARVHLGAELCSKRLTKNTNLEMDRFAPIAVWLQHCGLTIMFCRDDE